MNSEFNRKIALECSRRCLHSYKTQPNSDDPPEQHQIFNFAEQNCLNRCIGKYGEAHLAAKKTLDDGDNPIEMPPILYA
jgi:hypothetical protein